MKVIESKNKKKGFYGATVAIGRLNIAIEWPAAFRWVHISVPMWSATAIRDYLDGVDGRRLANYAFHTDGIANVNPASWRQNFMEYAQKIGKQDELVGIYERYSVEEIINKANKQLRDATCRLTHLMDILPDEDRESILQKEFRDYAMKNLKAIQDYLNDPQRR